MNVTQIRFVFVTMPLWKQSVRCCAPWGRSSSLYHWRHPHQHWSLPGAHPAKVPRGEWNFVSNFESNSAKVQSDYILTWQTFKAFSVFSILLYAWNGITLTFFRMKIRNWPWNKSIFLLRLRCPAWTDHSGTRLEGPGAAAAVKLAAAPPTAQQQPPQLNLCN